METCDNWKRLNVYLVEDEIYRDGKILPDDAREELLHSVKLEEIIGAQAEQLAEYGFVRVNVCAECGKIIVVFRNKYVRASVDIIIYPNAVVIEMLPILTGYGDMDDIKRFCGGLAALLHKHKKVKRRLHEVKEELMSLMEENVRTKEENAHLRLLPDAPDYLAAKAHFEQLAE